MYSKSQQTGQYGYKGRIKITTADKWFSIYIRLRDIKEYSANSSRFDIQCITCCAQIYWRFADCGHFVHRDRSMTRFNEQNCHAQCTSCNRFLNGKEYEHGKAIDKLYGAGTADNLKALGAIRGQKRHTVLALKAIAKDYRLKANKLAEKLGIEL